MEVLPLRGITPTVIQAEEFLRVALEERLEDPGGQGAEQKPAVYSGNHEGRLHPELYELARIVPIVWALLRLH